MALHQKSENAWIMIIDFNSKIKFITLLSSARGDRISSTRIFVCSFIIARNDSSIYNKEKWSNAMSHKTDSSSYLLWSGKQESTFSYSSANLWWFPPTVAHHQAMDVEDCAIIRCFNRIIIWTKFALTHKSSLCWWTWCSPLRPPMHAVSSLPLLECWRSTIDTLGHIFHQDLYNEGWLG